MKKSFATCISKTMTENNFKSRILFQNVNIFNGKTEKLAMGQDVLIEGNKIKKIGNGLKADGETTVIASGGKTLMPGKCYCLTSTVNL